MRNELGQFVKGNKHSEEVIEKLRKATLKNPVRYWLGKKMPKEMRDKISNAHKGKKLSEEHKRKMRLLIGDKSSNWKGGKSKHNNRWLIRNCKHPFAHKDGNVFQYRLVAEKCLCRYLTDIEIIHHINGDSSDDRPENLYLFESNKEHSFYHTSLRYNEIEKITKSNIL